jgi:hypothetical protein
MAKESISFAQPPIQWEALPCFSLNPKAHYPEAKAGNDWTKESIVIVNGGPSERVKRHPCSLRGRELNVYPLVQHV